MQLGAERGPEGSEAWGSIDVGSTRRISAGLRRLHPLSLGDFPDVMLASLAPGWGNARTKLGSRNSERPDWHRVDHSQVTKHTICSGISYGIL